MRGKHNPSEPPSPAEQDRQVPRARKIRLLAMILVLVALIGVTAALTAHTRGRRRRREQMAADAVQRAREALDEMDFAAAADAVERAAQLTPESAEPARLAVAVFYASGALDQAFDQFNRLELAGVGEIHGVGAAYVRRCGLLWNVAHRVTRNGESDRGKALLLCRWFALYLLPQERPDLPAEPYVVLWRGSGTPEEMAWAFAALARQARLSCRVVTFPGLPDEQPLVEVRPRDDAPFLVDPYRGVPVVDARSGELVPAHDVSSAFAHYRQLRARAEEPIGGEGDDPGEPVLKVALHPHALEPRFRAFESLLTDLPLYPILSADPREARPSGTGDLWAAPARILNTPPADDAARRGAQALQLVGPGRNEHLLGRHGRADVLYRQTMTDLEAKLAEADVAESIPILREAVEDLSFYRAVNAHEAGELDRAVERIRDYLESYPAGRWRTGAGVLLTDALERTGDPAAAARWHNVPRGRKLYALLRAEGLLPAPAYRRSEAEDAAPPAPTAGHAR